MDIYTLRDELGHSGFDNVQIRDVYSYGKNRPNSGLLFRGDLDDTYELSCEELDGSDITSIDIDFEHRTVTIDIDFGGAESYVALSKAYEEAGIDTPLALERLDEDELIEDYDWND